MKRLYAALMLFLSGLGAAQAQPSTIQAGATTVSVRTVATGLDTPWEMLWGPDNHLWLTERPGRISRLNPETGQRSLLLTVPDVTENGESGLLGMVLHPDFAASPYVYVVYNYTDGGLREKLVRYTFDGTTLTAPQVLLGNLPAVSTHSGSRLLILPDGTLLMTTGDAQNQPAAQSPASLNGKILRLNLDGTIPADNPTPDSYVYTLGHRNPQGLVQAPSGKVYSSEHGPDNDDEVNLIEAGRNYGWPTVQGFCNLAAEATFCTANNVREPLAAWTPTLAVAGLTYYNHPAIPEWQNSLLLVSLKAGQFLQLPLNATGEALRSDPVVLWNKAVGRMRAICVSPQGRVYLSTSNQDGRTAPAPTDDRIFVLENLAYQPTAARAPGSTPFTIWPNPTQGQLNLAFPRALGRDARLLVLDALGRTVASAFLPAGSYAYRLALPRVGAGVYQAVVETSTQTFRQRLVVQ